MGDKYIFETKNPTDYTASSKSRKDITAVLEGEGFHSIDIQIGDNKRRVLKEVGSIHRQMNSELKKIKNGSVIVFQYPWPTLSYSISKLIKKYSGQKSLKAIVYVHDLNSVRTNSWMAKRYYDFYVKEIRFLNNFDSVICHNGRMKAFLVKAGIPEDKVISLELFDYLTDKLVNTDGQSGKLFKTVNVAGNLSPVKAGYIYQLADQKMDSYKMRLFGAGYKGKLTANFSYEGAFPPDELPEHITDGFGLVWDGPTADTCAGAFGNYLKLNNPHKLSLYMACGLPVFVWTQSAISDFVINNGVGICVDSITEINDIMRHLTEEQYNMMKNKVHNIQQKAVTGGYTKKALLEAMNRT